MKLSTLALCFVALTAIAEASSKTVVDKLTHGATFTLKNSMKCTGVYKDLVVIKEGSSLFLKDAPDSEYATFKFMNINQKPTKIVTNLGRQEPEPRDTIKIEKFESTATNLKLTSVSSETVIAPWDGFVFGGDTYRTTLTLKIIKGGFNVTEKSTHIMYDGTSSYESTCDFILKKD